MGKVYGYKELSQLKTGDSVLLKGYEGNSFIDGTYRYKEGKKHFIDVDSCSTDVFIMIDGELGLYPFKEGYLKAFQVQVQD